jgi:hypothetical protein
VSAAVLLLLLLLLLLLCALRTAQGEATANWEERMQQIQRVVERQQV